MTEILKQQLKSAEEAGKRLAKQLLEVERELDFFIRRYESLVIGLTSNGCELVIAEEDGTEWVRNIRAEQAEAERDAMVSKLKDIEEKSPARMTDEEIIKMWENAVFFGDIKEVARKIESYVIRKQGYKVEN